MNNRAKQELDKIVSVLASTGVVSQIYLFGSYAKGEEKPNSDFDLCVLTTITDKRPIEQMQDFRLKLLNVQKMSYDLFAFHKDDFYNHAKRATSFHHEIVKNGVLLYDSRQS